MPRLEFRPAWRVNPLSCWLLEYKSDLTSQLGQDGILKKIFDIIPPIERYCVEVGAWDGKYLSNTYRLIAEEGWRGLLIEADGQKAADIKTTHPYERVEALHAFAGWDGTDSLDALLERANAPLRPDFLSIDVDGNDWHIWHGLKQYRPRVVLVEFNPTVPNDVLFVQDRDPNVSQGSSLLAFIDLAHEKGYSLVCALYWDAFFVDTEYFKDFGIADNSIDAMHSYAIGELRLFQGFDGTLFSAGCRKLLWKRVDGELLEFGPLDLQVLRHSQR